MKKYNIVIIGGDTAGLVTAITAQNEYSDKSILVIKAEEKGLIRCGIPYIFHGYCPSLLAKKHRTLFLGRFSKSAGYPQDKYRFVEEMMRSILQLI